MYNFVNQQWNITKQNDLFRINSINATNKPLRSRMGFKMIITSYIVFKKYSQVDQRQKPHTMAAQREHGRVTLIRLTRKLIDIWTTFFSGCVTGIHRMTATNSPCLNILSSNAINCCSKRHTITIARIGSIPALTVIRELNVVVLTCQSIWFMIISNQFVDIIVRTTAPTRAIK